jgi:hypothetical protein
MREREKVQRSLYLESISQPYSFVIQSIFSQTKQQKVSLHVLAYKHITSPVSYDYNKKRLVNIILQIDRRTEVLIT